MTHYDHVVVGSGSAGAVVASRLAESGKRVALFETGLSDENNEKVLDLTKWSDLLGTETDYDYKIEPQQRGNSLIRYSRGKVLGGCSSHNSCIAFYTPDYDLLEWVKLGAVGWDPTTVKPYFEKVRSKVNFESAQIDNPFIKDVFNAANSAGYPTIEFNKRDNNKTGIGWFDLNKRGNIRESSSVAYLHPLSQWGDRIHFFLNTKVTKIIIKNKRAIGVQTSQGSFYANGEVIICCGAIDTPKLLLLSGIGPHDHLKTIGIPTILNARGVGSHLLDHPEGVLNWELNCPMPKEFINYWEVGLFDKTSPDLGDPDIMMHLGIIIFDMNTKLYGYPTATHGFSLTPNVTRARSEGTIRLQSTNPDDNPLIDFKYFTDPYDERIIVSGFKRAREIASQPALSKWIKRELTPGPNVKTDEEISDYIRKTSNTVYHAAGSCKMGHIYDPLAVVDHELRVYGIANLRIADSSIFPTMIGVNPNITIMMIGERCADFIIRTNKIRMRAKI